MSASRASWPSLCVVLALALVALTLAPAASAKTQKQERASARVGESAQEHLQRIEAHLLAQEWKPAVASSTVLLRDFAAKVSGGEAAGPLLGMALMMRAVAESALDKKEDALWHWHSAVALFPGIVDADLTKYGPASKLLLDNKPAQRPAEPTPEALAALGVTEPSGEVTPPRKLHARPPAYPKGLLLSCLEGRVVIEVIVERNGLPSEPRIVDAPGGPLAAQVALEAMRGWRFKPATLAGEPVRVYYTLTVNFSIPRCG